MIVWGEGVLETHWVGGWGRGTRVVHRTPSVSNDQLKRRPNERNQRGKFVYPVEIVGFGASDCDFGLFRDYCVVCTMDIEEVRPDFEIGITPSPPPVLWVVRLGVCGWGRGTRVVHRTPSVTND